MMKRFFVLQVVILALISSQGYGFGVKDKLGIGFNVNMQKLYGDTRSGDFEYGGTPLLFRYDLNRRVFLDADLAYSKLSTRLPGNAGDNAQLLNFGFKVGYRFFSDTRFNPLLYLGVGAFNFKLDNNTRFWDGYGSVGTGAEYFVSPGVSLNLTGDFRYTSGDDFDGSRAAVGTDGFFTVAFGLNYYLGNRSRHSDGSDFAVYDDLYDITAEEALLDKVMEDQATSATAIVVTMAEVAALTDEKNALEQRVANNDMEIMLLKLKLNSVTEYEEMLLDRARITGVQPAGDSGDDPILREYKNALVLFEAEEFEDAIDAFRALLKQYPENEEISDWWYWLGESYFHVGDYDSAQKSFEWSLMTNRNHARDEITHIMLAMSQWRAGELQQAHDEFEFILRNTTDRECAKMVRGFMARIESELPAEE